MTATAPPAALATRQPDTRRIPLGALRTQAPPGAETAAQPVTRGTLTRSAFNSSI